MPLKILGPKPKPTIRKVYGKSHARYLELVSLFPLRRIETEDELDTATRVIDMLVDLEHRSKAEDDYLDMLSDLSLEYEEVHYPDPPVTDGEMLAFWMDIKEVSQTQLAKAVGIAESTISEVLRGKRKLTRTQIGKVAKYFKVSPAVFDFDG